MTNPYQDRVDIVKSLFGVLFDDMQSRVSFAEDAQKIFLYSANMRFE